VSFAQTENVTDGVCVISLAGEADLYAAPELKEHLLRAIARNGKKIVVDLSGVTFIDSTSLGVLVQGERRLRPAGGRLALVCADPSIVKVFTITALDRIFPIYGSREEAIAALGLTATGGKRDLRG
jgi:anti-sigma B factor antagonist